MTEEEKEEIKINVPIFTNQELREIDFEIETNYRGLIEKISKNVSRDREIIILKKVIQKHDQEINTLNNVIDKMAEDIKQTNISLANEGYEMETFWLNIDEIKKHFMEENQNV